MQVLMLIMDWVLLYSATNISSTATLGFFAISHLTRLTRNNQLFFVRLVSLFLCWEYNKLESWLFFVICLPCCYHIYKENLFENFFLQLIVLNCAGVCSFQQSKGNFWVLTIVCFRMIFTRLVTNDDFSILIPHWFTFGISFDLPFAVHKFMLLPYDTQKKLDFLENYIIKKNKMDLIPCFGFLICNCLLAYYSILFSSKCVYYQFIIFVYNLQKFNKYKMIFMGCQFESNLTTKYLIQTFESQQIMTILLQNTNLLNDLSKEVCLFLVWNAFT